MSDTKEKLFKGGEVLMEEYKGEDVLTPEDFTDEHKMLAQPTDDYIVKEVLTKIDNIAEHEFEHSVVLLHKAGELGLVSADIPEHYDGLGLDKVSSSLISEKLGRQGGFSISHGAHVGIGSLHIAFF